MCVCVFTIKVEKSCLFCHSYQMDALSYNSAMNWQHQTAASSSPFVCYVEDTSDPVFSIAAASALINEVGN